MSNNSFEEWWAEHQNDIGVRERLSEPRTLRARWTREIQEDLQAIHGIDSERLLSDILVDEIVNEMEYPPIMIPVVQRVMPQLLTGEITVVEPVNAPNGHVFSIRYNLSEGTNSVQVQELMKDHFEDNEDLFRI